MRFEKGASVRAVGKFGGSGRAAGIAQRYAQRFRFGGKLVLRRYRPAADAEGLERLQVVVFVPAGDIGPRDGGILSAGDFERPSQAGIWQMRAGGVRGERQKRQRGGDRPTRGGESSEARRV